MSLTVEAVRYVLVINRTQQDHYTPARQRAEVVVKKAAKGDKGDPGPKGEPGSSANDDPGDLTLWFDNALI